MSLLLEKGQYDVFRVYKCIELEHFPQTKIICRYGEIGDKFYIVLKGSVGVKVPTEVSFGCKTYMEIMRYVLGNYESIIKYKDNHSRVVKKFIDVCGQKELKGIGTLQALYDYLIMLKEERVKEEERKH